MNEQEWLGSDDPRRMLNFLIPTVFGGVTDPERVARLSDRKLRLFAAAAWRAARPEIHLTPEFADAVALAESVADGESELAYSMYSRSGGFTVLSVSAVESTLSAVDYASHRTEEGFASPEVMASLLRDMVGNPFAPVRPPHSYWLTPDALSVAQTAYRERPAFGMISTVALAVLSDALEEAGCTDTNILTHLRSEGPHVRGCWALDLVLGKN